MFVPAILDIMCDSRIPSNQLVSESTMKIWFGWFVFNVQEREFKIFFVRTRDEDTCERNVDEPKSDNQSR